MDGRRNNKGKVGNKGGRPARSEEQKLIETLTPLQPKAMIAFNAGLQDGERWAVELFFKYYYGLPKQHIDHTTDGEKINIPVINVYSEQS